MAFCIVEEDPNYHKYMLSILINIDFIYKNYDIVISCCEMTKNYILNFPLEFNGNINWIILDNLDNNNIRYIKNILYSLDRALDSFKEVIYIDSKIDILNKTTKTNDTYCYIHIFNSNQLYYNLKSDIISGCGLDAYNFITAKIAKLNNELKKSIIKPKLYRKIGTYIDVSTKIIDITGKSKSTPTVVSTIDDKEKTIVSETALVDDKEKTIVSETALVDDKEKTIISETPLVDSIVDSKISRPMTPSDEPPSIKSRDDIITELKEEITELKDQNKNLETDLYLKDSRLSDLRKREILFRQKYIDLEKKYDYTVKELMDKIHNYNRLDKDFDKMIHMKNQEISDLKRAKRNVFIKLKRILEE